MMLRTRKAPPDFAAILAEIDRGRPDEAFPPGEVGDTAGSAAAASDLVARSGHILGLLLAGLGARMSRAGTAARSRAGPAYVEIDGEAPAVEPQAPAQPGPKGEDEAIAEELGLTRRLCAADLRRLRRDFAKKNHPDRCAPAQRPRAARRMSIANMLIDAQLKQKRRP